METLQQLVFRVQLLGWTSRQQFEEIWMGLLSVLSSYPAAGAAPDELSIMLQVTLSNKLIIFNMKSANHLLVFFFKFLG